MKIKTSLTLSDDLVVALDKLAGPDVSRSAFIETILRDFIEGRAQERKIARDTAALNKQSAKLNLEMADVLGFQNDFAGK
jgi:metal-responsive CopG/Arc/MetJ family transcriptional regulator